MSTPSGCRDDYQSYARRFPRQSRDAPGIPCARRHPGGALSAYLKTVASRHPDLSQCIRWLTLILICRLNSSRRRRWPNAAPAVCSKSFMPARIKRMTLRVLAARTALAQVRASKRPAVGTTLKLADAFDVTVGARVEPFHTLHFPDDCL